MRIKKVRPKNVKASKSVIRRRNIKADEEVMDEEILESTRKPLRNKKSVKASTRRVARRRAARR